MDNLLQRIRRPIQYVGGEVNAVHKEEEPERIRFALVFPDTYELGMSHQGLKILYHILNSHKKVAAERVFAPEADMESLLRSEKKALPTLESGTPLNQCDLVGFTLQSELHYTNILNILDLGQIPLWASERCAGDPLIIGGGPQAFNPEPLAEFFDLFVLGDGEEVVLEIADAYNVWRSSGKGREELLTSMTHIDGIYIPSLYRIEYGESGLVEKIRTLSPEAPPRVRRRIVYNLDRCPFPEDTPVPFMETTHDRLTVEVARGCIRGCRFCHAGIIYRPYRERSPQMVEKIITSSLPRTGYDEVSLSALSAGDYCHLVSLVKRLSAHLEPNNVSISLPSIRPGSLPDDVIRKVGSVRKSGLTIAPEAGSDRLRRVINKGITETDILTTAEYIFRNGWKSLKLYFMIGLPTETDEDVEGILKMALKIKRTAKNTGSGQPHITVSVSSFVPKAHTPFQWFPMADPDYLAGTIKELSRRCRQAKIGFKWHNPEMSSVEGLLSRGDRRLAGVIYEVWRQGGRMEAWSDNFDISRWFNALSRMGLDLGFYARRMRGEREINPWDHMDTMVSKKFLLKEYHKSQKGLETSPCRIGDCHACGACPSDAVMPRPKPVAASAVITEIKPDDKRFKIRLSFEKTGMMKYLSHLELLRAFYRACRRAGLPISYTSGFNPHPRISFGPPLPVGAEGEGELVDLGLNAPYPAKKLIRELNRSFPKGLRITDAHYLYSAAPSLFGSVDASFFRISFQEKNDFQREDISRRLQMVLSQESLMVEREKGGKRKRKDVRKYILKADLMDNDDQLNIDVWLGHNNEGSIRISEFLGILLPGESPWPQEISLRRLGLYRMVMGKPVNAFMPPGPCSRDKRP